MKIILFLVVLILLLFFIYNKKEYFDTKVVGDISFSDYELNDVKLAKFFSDNFLVPTSMNYTIGKEGVGIEQEINTLSFKPESMEAVIPEAIKMVGGKKMTNLEAVVPILFYGTQQNIKKINDVLIDIESVKGEIVELKKKMLT
jgi:hypothetical protein